MSDVVRAFRSELLKLAPLRRLALLCLSGVAALGAILTVATAGSTSLEGPGNNFNLSVAEIEAADGLSRALSGASTLVGVVALCFTAWAFGQEYSNRTLQGLLVRLPRKLRLLSGKLGATLVLMAIGLVAAALVASLAAVLTALTEGFDTSSWWSADGFGETSWTLVRMVISGWAWAIGGACLAVLLRSPVAAIGVGLAYAVPLESLLTAAIDGLDAWLPGSLLNAFVVGGNDVSGLGRSALVALTQIAILAVVSAFVFIRRVDDA